MSQFVTPFDRNLAKLVSELDEDSREFFEERAGILEYEASYPRAKAEALAWEETLTYLNRRRQSGDSQV